MRHRTIRSIFFIVYSYLDSSFSLKLAFQTPNYKGNFRKYAPFGDKQTYGFWAQCPNRPTTSDKSLTQIEFDGFLITLVNLIYRVPSLSPQKNPSFLVSSDVKRADLYHVDPKK